MTAINRPLTDSERDLMHQLAVQVVAEQTNAPVEAAADALDSFVAEGKVVLRVNSRDAYLDAAGKTLVHITREELAFAANHPDEATLAAQPIAGDGGAP